MTTAFIPIREFINLYNKNKQGSYSQSSISSLLNLNTITVTGIKYKPSKHWPSHCDAKLQNILYNMMNNAQLLVNAINNLPLYSYNYLLYKLCGTSQPCIGGYANLMLARSLVLCGSLCDLVVLGSANNMQFKVNAYTLASLLLGIKECHVGYYISNSESLEGFISHVKGIARECDECQSMYLVSYKPGSGYNIIPLSLIKSID